MGRADSPPERQLASAAGAGGGDDGAVDGDVEQRGLDTQIVGHELSFGGGRSALEQGVAVDRQLDVVALGETGDRREVQVFGGVRGRGLTAPEQQDRPDELVAAADRRFGGDDGGHAGGPVADAVGHVAAQVVQSGVLAAGERGLVMVCFTLPSFDVVFKVIRDRFASAAVAGTRPNRADRTDPYRLTRSPIQRSDSPRDVTHKFAGGMRLEDDIRRLVQRVTYRGART